MLKPPILRYLIEGFAILVRAMQNLKNLEQKGVDKAVFGRLLFHLTEQFIALRTTGGPTNPVLSNELSGSKSLAEFIPAETELSIQNEGENQHTKSHTGDS